MTPVSSIRTRSARKAAPYPREDHLRKLTEALRGNLEKCAANPEVDPVHDVRTGTRRLQATIEAILREHSGEALQQAAAEWLAVLKKIRRAAAPVRDLDVHRELLRKSFPMDKAATADAAISEDPVAHQVEHLDAWLHHARQHNAAQLKKKPEKLLAGFGERAAAFAVALQHEPRSRRRPRSAAVVALESFAQLLNTMQYLDPGNLHDFRKGAKKARYIAESAAEDAQALAVGKALKKLQDDIGDWHDWLVLSEEARVALGEEGKELVALLDEERERRYAVAMKTVTRLRGRLMGEWLAISSQRRSHPRAASRKAIVR